MSVWGGIKRFGSAIGGVVAAGVGVACVGAGVFVNLFSWLATDPPYKAAAAGMGAGKTAFGWAADAFKYAWNGDGDSQKTPLASTKTTTATTPPAKNSQGNAFLSSNNPAKQVDSNMAIIQSAHMQELLDTYDRNSKSSSNRIKPVVTKNNDGTVQMNFKNKTELSTYFQQLADLSGKPFVVKDKNGAIMAISKPDGRLYNPNTQQPYGHNEPLQAFTQANKVAGPAVPASARSAPTRSASSGGASAMSASAMSAPTRSASSGGAPAVSHLPAMAAAAEAQPPVQAAPGAATPEAAAAAAPAMSSPGEAEDPIAAVNNNLN